MTPEQLDALAFAACLAGAAAPLVLLIRRKRKLNQTYDFADLIESYNQAEEDARQRGDTRAVGKARKDRRDAVHASLRRAA